MTRRRSFEAQVDSEGMRYKVVEVEWEDHSFNFGDSTAKLAQTVTVGYLVEDCDEYVIVALSMVDGIPHDKMFIDRRMVLRTRVVRRSAK